MKRIVIFSCLVSFFLMGNQQCSQEKIIKGDAIESFLECKKNSDCTEVNDGCCGCRNGGKQKALNISHKKII